VPCFASEYDAAAWRSPVVWVALRLVVRGGSELTNSEQKFREAVLVPPRSEGGAGRRESGLSESSYTARSASAIDGDASWDNEGDREGGNGNGGEREGAGGKREGADASDKRGIYQPRGAKEQMTDRTDRGRSGQEELKAGEGAPHDLNQSLARLEMNSLEVKLYLDSIDQRISRMEPRLEEMRGPEPESAQGTELAEGADARRGEVAAAEPVLSTTERRRRAQGVPVERRRTSYAMPAEVEEVEPWSWKPWTWKAWERGSGDQEPGNSRHADWRGRLLAHKRWAPVVLLGVGAVLGVAYWSSGQHSTPKNSTGAAGLGAGLESATGHGARKGSGEVPGGRSSMQGSTGRTEAPNRVGGTRAGSVKVEQGVAVLPGNGVGVPATYGQAYPNNNGEVGNTAKNNVTNNSGTTSGDMMGSPSEGSGAGTVAAETGASDRTTAEAGSSHSVSSSPAVASSGSTAGGSNSNGSSSSSNGPSSSTPSPRIIPPSPSRVHVSSGVMAGNLLYSQAPQYPHGFAGLFHSQGKVVMQAIISKNGQVENLRVISGHYMLRGAAKDAVRKWRYRPYSIRGSPVEVATIISVEFRR